MIRKIQLAILLFTSLLVFTLSCSKSIAVKESRKVDVSNVDQLYIAINDPANVGTTIVLAPGTYMLSAGYPNGGRLELQHNMSLVGKEGSPDAVIINVTGLPTASLTLPASPTYPVALRTGTVRMGNGSNSIEWLTLYNDPTHSIRSLIQTDLVSTAFTQIRIAHTIVKGASIGISIVNRDVTSNGRDIEAILEDNDITGNTLTPIGSGLQIQNSQAVSGAVIRATLRRNYVHGNRAGISVLNGSSIQNQLFIKSYSDRIEENGIGLDLIGGAIERVGFPGTDNFTGFEANGTAIRNNLGTPAPLVTPNGHIGAISAIGGFGTIMAGSANNNKLEISLRDCLIEGNGGPYSINAFGAFSSNLTATPAGTNNTVAINLSGVSKQVTINAISSFPAEAAGTNRYTVFK